MEPEGSSPHQQAPANCTYPEPDQFSPWSSIPLLEDPFQYYPPIYAYVFQVVSFPIKFKYAPLLSPVHATHPAHRIIIDLITQIVFPRHIVFSTPVLPVTSSLLGA